MTCNITESFDGTYTMVFNDPSITDSGDMTFIMYEFFHRETIKRLYDAIRDNACEKNNIQCTEYRVINPKLGTTHIMSFDNNRQLTIEFIQKVDDEILSRIKVNIHEDDHYNTLMN